MAHGGFGTLLAARRESDGQKVAIKVAHPDSPLAWRHLFTEAAALRAIGAPLVPEVYETGSLSRGEPYLVMRFISHPTLARVLALQGGPMPMEVFAPGALALVDTLGAVHARGFLHGDLKPENIFLDDTAPTAILFDFGLARRLGAPASLPIPYAATPPTHRVLAGTVEYMAPEQCEGEPDLDVRTDLYALGVILYEMLTGRPPFFGTLSDVTQAHVSRRPARPSELAAVPVALEQVVLRCLAKERDRRFQSATELREALQQSLFSHAPPPPPPPATLTPPERVTPPTSTHRSVAGLFFRSGSNPVVLQKELAGFGGQLVFQEGSRFVGVFDPDVGENPIRRAHQAVRGLSARGLVSTALLDVVSVTVQRRPGGAIRYLSPTFSRQERFPSGNEPRLLLLTAAAAEALPEQPCVPVPDRDGLFQCLPSSAVSGAPFQFQQHKELVGRDGELAELMRSAKQSVAERVPSLITVLGDRGQGKTHLCATLAEQLQVGLPQARVYVWRAREPVQGDPEGTLRLLLQQALYGVHASGASFSGSEGEGRGICVELLGPRLAMELWPGVAATLGWRSPSDARLQHWATAPGALRSLAMRATGELLVARARQRPLCILLDDVHYAEETALNALEYATLAESRLPLWVCVLARPGFERHRPSWGSRAAHQRVLSLGPLPPASATELCRILLRPAENVPTEAIERLAERAQYIPLFLVELVRGLKRQGLVRQRAGGESWYLVTDELERMPELHLVEWLVDRELGALPPELAAHARLCALLGPDFTAAEAEGVVHVLESDGGAVDFPLDPRHATRRLQELGLLVDHEEGLCFRNELLRATVERSLPEADRVRFHHAAFRYFLSEAGATRRQRLPRLALHASAAGLRSEAVALYIDLAESARGHHAYLEAESTYTRALELLDVEDTRRRFTVLRGRGLMRYRVGRSEDSLADFAAARELARRLGDLFGQVELLLDEAMAYDWRNEYVRAEMRVSLAQELASSANLQSPLLQVRLLLGLGRALFRNGQWKEACTLLEDTVQRARGLGDAGYESLVVAQLLLGFILPNLGRIDEAERILEEAITSCTERGDRLHLGSILNNRRNLWVARNDLKGALRDQERFMQLGRELGLASWEFFAEHNMGELLYQSGAPEAAAPHIARAIELERRHPEVAPRPWALLLQARLHAYTGRDFEARALLTDIQIKLEARGAEFSSSEEVLVSLVELATREASAEEWLALGRRSDACSVEQEPLEVLEVQALARWRRGERKEALRLMDEALARAARVPNIMGKRLRRSRERVLTPARR
ncbi:serine/threonine-protein kinase PknK [Archangium violaceum]|uniref:serine/threonine-protein kinase n=1 Tax=Archangium violaceum TaxID=83451 RepID=UPI001EF09C31|nr:serine/threonine-protein kinase [Archangium violaceum]